MRCAFRLGICGVATALTAVGLNAKYPGGPAGFAADLCSLPRLEAKLRDETEKESELHEHSAAILVSIHARQQIVANLVAREVGDRARIFAGAGVVAGSRPEAEWRETEAKSAPMLEAIGGA